MYYLLEKHLASATLRTVSAYDTYTVFVLTHRLTVETQPVAGMSLSHISNLETTNLVLTIPLKRP